MSSTALVWTLAFAGIAMLLSAYNRIGLEREIAWGAVRATLQLLAIGYVLQFLFSSQSWLYVGLMLTIMLGVAVQVATKRGGGIPGTWPRVAIALLTTELLTMGLMLLTGQLKPEAQQVIPVSGMIIGNAMVTAGLLLNRMRAEMRLRREEVQLWLSLGATPRQASAQVVRTAVRACMIPTIDGLKTVGLVQLPGMMTGQIMAGADPAVAVRYQILIMFALASAAALVSILLALLCYPLFFTPAMQLRWDQERT